MAETEVGRKTVVADRKLVVFMVGARINKWWLLPLALPILSKMRNMQRELLADPDSGLLAIQSMGSADVLYWRSLEDLQRYAHDPEKEHKPAAKGFFRRLFKNQSVGIWHEVYVVPSGNYDCTYVNMPRFGLGKTSPLIDVAEGRRRLASGVVSKAAA